MGKAEEYYGRALLASPGDGEVLSLYGSLIWETQRDEDRAHGYFDQAVKASPEDWYEEKDSSFVVSTIVSSSIFAVVCKIFYQKFCALGAVLCLAHMRTSSGVRKRERRRMVR